MIPPSTLGHKHDEEEFKNGNHMAIDCATSGSVLQTQYSSGWNKFLYQLFVTAPLPIIKLEQDWSRLSRGLSLLYRHLFSVVPLIGKDKILFMEKQQQQSDYLRLKGSKSLRFSTTLFQDMREYGSQLHPFVLLSHCSEFVFWVQEERLLGLIMFPWLCSCLGNAPNTGRAVRYGSQLHQVSSCWQLFRLFSQLKEICFLDSTWCKRNRD